MSFYGAFGARSVAGRFIRKFAGFNGVFMFFFILCLMSLIILLMTSYDIKVLFGIEHVFIASGMAGIAGCSVFLILSESNAKKELTEICERSYASKTEA